MLSFTVKSGFLALSFALTAGLGLTVLGKAILSQLAGNDFNALLLYAVAVLSLRISYWIYGKAYYLLKALE